MEDAVKRIERAIAEVRSGFPFERYMDDAVAAYVTVADTLGRYLPEGASVLDFGSGPCDKTAVAQRLGYRCTAADDLEDDWHKADDNRQKIVDFARSCGITFIQLKDDRLPAAGDFDMVMLHDVLEHLHDSPKELLNDLVALLKPEGLLFITVPNAVNIRKRLDVLFGRTNLPRFDGYYWYPGPWRGHIREYTRGDLILLCDFLSLDVVELGSRHHMIHKLAAPLQGPYRAITSLFPDWRDTWLLVARKRSGWQPRRSLSDAEMRRIFGSDCPHYLYMD